MNHLIDWQHLSDDVWNRAIERALHHRATKSWMQSAAGKSLGMMFFNSSLRTRTSMELAASQLGAHASTINIGQGVWNFEWSRDAVMDGNTAEHIEEAVGVLSRYYDALGVRLFASGENFEEDRSDTLFNMVASRATVPVINLESAYYHPCQALADAATISGLGDPRGKRFVLTWAYHPKALPMAVPNSALLMAARLGMHVTVARPDTHALDSKVVAMAQSLASGAGGSVSETNECLAADEDTHIVYAKAWGGPMVYTDPQAEMEARESSKEWRVTMERMGPAARFMHCLPVRRGVVVDEAVLKSGQALHLDQAENRLHAQKAILEYVWDII